MLVTYFIVRMSKRFGPSKLSAVALEKSLAITSHVSKPLQDYSGSALTSDSSSS
jgi:hypothetical protein